MTTTRQWLLNDHPRGRGIEDGDFKLAATQVPPPGEGEFLLQTEFLGLLHLKALQGFFCSLS